MNTKKTIADLRDRITIKLPTGKKRDAEGNIIHHYDTSITVWANIEAYAARISKGPAEQINEINYRVTIRHRKDITSKSIVMYGEKTLELIAPPYSNDKSWLQMDCREIVA